MQWAILFLCGLLYTTVIVTWLDTQQSKPGKLILAGDKQANLHQSAKHESASDLPLHDIRNSIVCFSLGRSKQRRLSLKMVGSRILIIVSAWSLREDTGGVGHATDVPIVCFQKVLCTWPTMRNIKWLHHWVFIFECFTFKRKSPFHTIWEHLTGHTKCEKKIMERLERILFSFFGHLSSYLEITSGRMPWFYITQSRRGNGLRCPLLLQEIKHGYRKIPFPWDSKIAPELWKCGILTWK